MVDGKGLWVVHEARDGTDGDGPAAHRGTLVHGDVARVEALSTEPGWERRGATFWADDVADALEQAHLLGMMGGAVHGPDADPDVVGPEHVEVTCGDAAAERALRARVAVAHETSDALCVRTCDLHLVAEVMATGADLSVRPAATVADGLWPEWPEDGAPSP